MKLKYLLAVLVVAQCAGADQSGSNLSENVAKSDERVLRTNKALKSYKETYVNLPQNKAFAQSPDGHWNWRADRVTLEMAKEDALAACNKHVKKNEQACVIININDEWIKPPQ